MTDTAVALAPEQPVTYPAKKLSAQERIDLGQSLYASVNAALGDRASLDIALDDWNDQYEMNLPDKVFPWPDSSNVFIPLTPTKVDELAAQMAQALFVPRLFIVTGNTPIASKYQHQVERYYNAEAVRYSWLEAFYQWLHLSIRDGTSYLGIFWKKETTTRPMMVGVPRVDPETGVTPMDPENPEEPAAWDTVKKVVTRTVHDSVELTPIELRDLLLVPAWAPSVEKALAVCWKKYLSEDELLSMQSGIEENGGYFYKDALEEALSVVAMGNSELPNDQQGTRTYEIGGMISVGNEQGQSVGDFQAQRGPLRIYQIHTKQFDLNGDGRVEENICWIHDQTQKLIAYMPYPYFMDKRPFVPMMLMPRPNRAYGFSLVERLRSIQAELNGQHNARNDMMDMILNGPMYKKAGSKVDDESKRWAPGAFWEVQEKDDVGRIPVGDIPQSLFIEENLLNQLANELAGTQPAPRGGGRATAKQIQAEQSQLTTRLNLMAMRGRMGLQEAFLRIHDLTLQYGPESIETTEQVGGAPQKFQLPKALLAQDYEMSIAGQFGPLDKNARLQEELFLYSLAQKNPIVSSDMVKVYRFLRRLLEQYSVADIIGLIGSEDEAKQMQAAAQQARQAQMAQQQQSEQLRQASEQQRLAQGHPPQGGNGKPAAANGQRPPGANAL